jgi:hypothetical protein
LYYLRRVVTDVTAVIDILPTTRNPVNPIQGASDSALITSFQSVRWDVFNRCLKLGHRGLWRWTPSCCKIRTAVAFGRPSRTIVHLVDCKVATRKGQVRCSEYSCRSSVEFRNLSLHILHQSQLHSRDPKHSTQYIPHIRGWKWLLQTSHFATFRTFMKRSCTKQQNH